MRHDIPGFAVAACMMMLIFRPAHAAAPRLSVHAYPENQAIKRDQGVVICVDLMNAGTGKVNFPQSNGAVRNAWLDYTVHIHDQYGRAPALTRLGERLFHPSQPQFGGVQVNPFGPGQAATETLQLSALYVLEPHRYYSISLEFNKPVRFLTTPLRSNWITVSVK